MFVHRLRNSPLGWWLAVIAAATVTSVTIGHLVGQAEDAAARYGNPRTVLVTRHAVEMGEVIRPGDFREAQLPHSLLPHSRPVVDPVGRVAAVPLAANEVITRNKVGGDNGGSGALLSQDERGVAIPNTNATPRLRIGDRVDVLATFATEGSGEPTYTVARGARVIGLRRESTVIALERDDAARVVFAVSRNAAVLVLSPPLT